MSRVCHVEVEASIDRYLDEMAKTDKHEPAENQQPLEDKIPDARSMKSRGQGIVGYNVQTAVDIENHIIIAHLERG